MTHSYLNIYTHIKMLSQMSSDDIRNLGTTLGLGDMLDNPQSIKFNSVLSPTGGTANVDYPPVTTKSFLNIVGGNGFSNNAPFAVSPATADFGDLVAPGSEFYNTYNNGYYSRLKK